LQANLRKRNSVTCGKEQSFDIPSKRGAGASGKSHIGESRSGELTKLKEASPRAITTGPSTSMPLSLFPRERKKKKKKKTRDETNKKKKKEKGRKRKTKKTADAPSHTWTPKKGQHAKTKQI